MTMGSQGPAGARVLEKCGSVERGAPPPSLPPLLSQVRIEGQEGLMCCCCTEVWAITMAASMSVYFLPPKREVCCCDLFFWPLGSTSFSNCGLKRFSFDTVKQVEGEKTTVYQFLLRQY